MPDAEVLYEHAGFLRAIARGLLLDEDQADDVVQQTLVAALEAREAGRGWLARVARNLSLMRRRSEGRRARRERAAARPEDGVAPTVDVVARLEMQRRVVDAVLELGEPYRSTVVYRYFDGLPPAEIAAREGVPRATVQTRLKRARKTLRARFDREVLGGRRAWSAALLPLALPRTAAAAAFTLSGLLTMKTVLALGAVLFVAVAYLTRVAVEDRDVPMKTVAIAPEWPPAPEAVPDEEPVEETGPNMTVLVRVLDPAREPVAGALVQVVAPPSDPRPGADMRRKREVLKFATTGAAGVATLPGVPFQDFAVFVDHPDYARGFAGFDSRSPHPLELEVVLGRGGSIEGKVTDPSGKPVSGATVFLHEEEARAATTDESGAYRLTRVAGGSYRVLATSPDFGPGFFGASMGWNEPVAVPVRAGAVVRDIDIALTPPAFVTGHLVNAEGEPVPGATVYVWTEPFDGRITAAATHDDGAFAVGPLPIVDPSDFSVWASHARYVLPNREHPQARGADLGVIAATECAVVKGRILGKFIKARAIAHPVGAPWMTFYGEAGKRGEFEVAVPPGRIEVSADGPWLRSPARRFTLGPGEVVEGVELRLGDVFSVSGQVRDQQGRPLAVVALACHAIGSDPRWSLWTDEDGRYEFDGLAAGEYRVGLTDLATSGMEIVLQDHPAPRTVQAGATDVDFVLEATGALVRGRVVAKRDGRPVRDFEVSWMSFKLLLPDESGWGQRAGDDGRFVCRLEKPGTYAVNVEAPGFAPLRTTRFTVTGEDIDLGDVEVGDMGALTGTVRDAAGRAVAYARVHVVSAKLEVSPDPHFTDADGRFEIRGLAPGAYNLFIVSPHHPLGIVRSVPVKEGETTDVQHALDAAAPLTLLVRDADGQPIEGAELVYTFEALQPLNSSLASRYEPLTFGANRSDERGTIRKPYMPAGEVILSVTAAGHRPWQQALPLQPGEQREVEVRLQPEPK